jgi:hypothetical protein
MFAISQKTKPERITGDPSSDLIATLSFIGWENIQSVSDDQQKIEFFVHVGSCRVDIKVECIRNGFLVSSEAHSFLCFEISGSVSWMDSIQKTNQVSRNS